MTADRDFKRLIRREHSTDIPKFSQSIDCLQLTLKTTRFLRSCRIETIGQLAAQTAAELAGCGLDGERRTEVREVLASRGL